MMRFESNVSEKGKILVVEDNDFVRMQIVKFLQDGGYEPLEASGSDAGDAILSARHASIKCMLVDVRMEPEDGFDFLNRVELNEYNIPAILVTGDNDPEILSKGASVGVASVLMKPVNKDRLLKMVDRAIQIAGHKS
jgi:CheY-like chemotaxis protein